MESGLLEISCYHLLIHWHDKVLFVTPTQWLESRSLGPYRYYCTGPANSNIKIGIDRFHQMLAVRVINHNPYFFLLWSNCHDKYCKGWVLSINKIQCRRFLSMSGRILHAFHVLRNPLLCHFVAVPRQLHGSSVTGSDSGRSHGYILKRARFACAHYAAVVSLQCWAL